jgi:chaperonin GroEL (HSP60 family)
MKKEEKRIEIKNKNAIFSNINACIQVGEELKPLLGPFGGDLMFQDEEKNILVSNDGTEVLKHLKIEHPSALMFSEVKNNKIYKDIKIPGRDNRRWNKNINYIIIRIIEK